MHAARGFEFDFYIHRGMPALTSAAKNPRLIESLEGKKGQPRYEAAIPGKRRRLGLPIHSEQR